jgi:hypothetical protein
MCLRFEFKLEITKRKDQKSDLVLYGYNSEVDFEKTGFKMWNILI